MNNLLSLMDVYVSIEFEELGIKAGGEVGVPKELQAVVRAVEDARNDLCMIGAVANEGLKVCDISEFVRYRGGREWFLGGWFANI